MIVVGIFRATLSSHEKCLLDSHTINSYEDLYKTAVMLKPASTKEKGRARPHTNYRSNDGLRCYKCHGWGHRALDCKKPDVQPVVACYVCNQAGHKAPDCTMRADKIARKDNAKVDDKTGKTQRHQAKSQAVAALVNTLIEFKGKCNGKWCMFLPDSGAVMSMVSEDLVEEHHFVGTYECLVLANGQVIRCPMAR